MQLVAPPACTHTPSAGQHAKIGTSCRRLGLFPFIISDSCLDFLAVTVIGYARHWIQATCIHGPWTRTMSYVFTLTQTSSVGQHGKLAPFKLLPWLSYCNSKGSWWTLKPGLHTVPLKYANWCKTSAEQGHSCCFAILSVTLQRIIAKQATCSGLELGPCVLILPTLCHVMRSQLQTRTRISLSSSEAGRKIVQATTDCSSSPPPPHVQSQQAFAT